MIRFVLKVGSRKWGSLTIRRSDRMDGEGRICYYFKIRKYGRTVIKWYGDPPKKVSYRSGQGGYVWHRPEDGIWKLIWRVIRKAKPDIWFPRPDGNRERATCSIEHKVSRRDRKKREK